MVSQQPNFLVIVADDLGYSDIGCFGSEIATPNIDSLAKEGTRFTDFHTAAACSPTRSMLMSGTDHHLVGLGQLIEFVSRSPAHMGKPGHEGYLSEKVATLPEVLRDGGYHTVMAGKWHLGLKPEYAPVSRGFTKSFALLPGAANHYAWEPEFGDVEQPGFLQTTTVALHIEDDKYFDNDKLPKDFYSSDHYANKLVEYLEDRPKDKPFFAYLPFSAPHWPLQAPKESREKYKGNYNDGPAVLREKRLDAQVKLGLLDPDVRAHPAVTVGTPEWETFTPDQKEKSARSMEVYAGMVDRMDWNIGKVIAELKRQGVYDNTVILFMSDNGAEGASYEALPVLGQKMMETIQKVFNNSLDNIGNKDSWVWYGSMWAQAATAPSRLWKLFSTEGGSRVPFVFKDVAQRKQEISTQFSTVMDLMPTFLDLAGVPYPGKVYNGREVLPFRGKSWVKYLKGESERIHEEDHITGWELVGHAALRKGDWKIDFVNKPHGPEKWQLYDLSKDPGETEDLAEKYPDKLQELIEHWEEYRRETNVVGLRPEFDEIAAHDEMDDPRKWMKYDTSYSISQQIKAGKV